MGEKILKIQCKYTSYPVSKKLKFTPLAGKVVSVVFWDSTGRMLVHFQKRGTTMSIVRYSDVLHNRLKCAV
jgi:hypothetical protein